MTRTHEDRLRLVVGIATAGRPELVSCAVDHLRQQTRPPDLVLVAACDPADVAGVAGERVACIFSPRGLTRQRNAILRDGSNFDVIVFFDDDFLPLPTYLEELEEVFVAHPDVVMVTGHVIADDITGPGFSIEEARHRLKADGDNDTDRETLVEVHNGYGCNMAVRVRVVKDADLHFDERLPLYGWLEDVDFSRRLARWGRIVRTRAARGVHMGVKSGRQSGIRLGYSQIANPVYLMRKGTFGWPRAIGQISRNIAMNLIFSLRPERYVDRWGRLRGNIKAIEDLVRGRLAPERVLTI